MGAPDPSSLRVLRGARDRIDRDYSGQISIPVLAAQAGYSREHFIRAFKATYGETPGRYRTRRRVERACDLLRSVNLTVTEVCYQVGFSSLGSFSARFTEVTGMSPTAYRLAARERGGPAPIPGCYALMWRSGLPGSLLLDKPSRAPDRYRLRMITGIPIVAVWVLDQDAAKEFYTAKLGCTVTNDIELDNGMRWLTVRPAGSSGQELLLIDPARSMLDQETASQVRTLVAKGALSPGVMATSDCTADHAELAARGVEFIQPPAKRPYGVEAILRDDSGNWYSFTERATGDGTLQFCPWRNRADPASWPGMSCGRPTTTATGSWSYCG